MKSWQKIILAGIAALLFGCLIIFALPSLRERVINKLDTLRIQVFYALNPPEQSVFSPVASTPDPKVVEIVRATLTQMAAKLASQQSPTPAPTIAATDTPLPPEAPTLTPTATIQPLPAKAVIENVPYVDQHYGYNNCAPATLTMYLNFWGDPVKREVISKAVKPFDKDKNVMPYELVDYVNAKNDGLKAIDRVGGTQDLLKRLIAAGYPVMIERGVYLVDLSGKLSWMGHYQLLYGYDDASAVYQVKDAFEKDGAKFTLKYDELDGGWRSFNYAFVLLFPGDKEATLKTLLSPYDDADLSARLAYETASQEANSLTGQDQFFAWYNRGSSMVKLGDYNGAAQSFDQAFSLYAALPADKRPWRIVWYETGPYFAYFNAGRYQDVINLADKTITTASEPYIEESFYWRARAKGVMGDTQGAIDDLKKSLEYHPDFSPSVEMLKQLGVTP